MQWKERKQVAAHLWYEDVNVRAFHCNAEIINLQITVDLMHGKEKVNDLTFRKLLENNGTMDDVLLQIVGEPYKVIYNTPWVEVITLPTSILAGFFIYPAKLDLLFAEKKHSKFEWYRGLLVSVRIQRNTAHWP